MAFQQLADTVAISASTTTATTTTGSDIAPGKGVVARVYNAAASAAFFRFAGTATAAGVPIPAGAAVNLEWPGGEDVAVILASGTGTVYVTVGQEA
ncbi:hypothetical protein [Thalassospira sp.]|uniref:hypothetical protein n=1 Tax=Thalassospira sp. TaxID=1912094 RepID=UPI000C54094C|nr:hypothetical protein [Thalassospira sp.]MAL41397.1 hypothetical protein [Thalassospira sp.]